MSYLTSFAIRTVCAAALAGACALPAVPVLAQQDEARQLPRFVSTRNDPINVRVGPGTRYDISWVFTMEGLPVEIIQEFDVWRKIRYIDGEEGWIHQNLLTSQRTAIVQPFGGGDRTAMRQGPTETTEVRAWLGNGFLVNVDGCADGWCQVTTTASEASRPIQGYVSQIELWGVYPDEEID